MKLNWSVAIAALLVSGAANAASADGSSAPQAAAQGTPKNLARQHLGANLLVFNQTTQKFVPTEAAAAWLDDDVATGWPAMSGHQYYLVTLAEPQLLTNFCISTRTSAGTVSLYAGDELAAPTAKSWSLLEKNASIDAINQKLGKPFSRFAKYLLIETNLTETGPWYSLYLYGDKSATAYHVQRRAQPVDPRTIFGPYVNPETNFSMSSLYARGRVAFANAADGAATWQKAIDDNPETAVSIAPSEKEGGLVIRYENASAIQRIAVLSDGNAKGKLDFYVMSTAAAAAAQNSTDSQYIKASSQGAEAAPAFANGVAVSVANQTPVATIRFDGSSARGSADFAPVPGSVLVARWTPDSSGQLLAVREVNSFSDASLNDNELAAAPDSATDRNTADERSDLRADSSKDGGKQVLAPVGEAGKETLPPAVGEVLPPKTPFIPGPPAFPPNPPVQFTPVSQ